MTTWLSRAGFRAWMFYLLAAACSLTAATFVITTAVAPAWAALVFLIASLADLTAHRLFQACWEDTGRPPPTLYRYGNHALWFGCVGLLCWRSNPALMYVFATPAFIMLWAYLGVLKARYTHTGNRLLKRILHPDYINARLSTSPGKRVFWSLAGKLTRAEVFPFLTYLFMAAGLVQLLFWSGLFIIALVLSAILILLHGEGSDEARSIYRSASGFLFYTLGICLLLFLVTRMPFNDVSEALATVGHEAWWLILIPVTWVVPDAMILKVLLDGRIRFRDALYTQVTGDGFNAVTPLLGLGGEPYKARRLSRYVPLADSSRAIIRSRLIHALSGVIFTGMITGLCMVVIDFSRMPGVVVGLGVLTAVMVVATILLLWVTMSHATSRFTGFVLTRFRLIEEFRHEQLAWHTLAITMLLKLIGRSGKFLELYLIFLVMDISPSFTDVVLVAALVMASVSLFFFVPQGIGVNEVGIVTAFEMAGYTAATGVVYGLIRRARMVSYALIGVSVYAIGTAFSLHRSRRQRPAS